MTNHQLIVASIRGTITPIRRITHGAKMAFLGNFYIGTKTMLMNIFWTEHRIMLPLCLDHKICTFWVIFYFFMSKYIIISSMSFRHGNCCFHQKLNAESCQHAELTSSINSLHHLFCPIKFEEDNNADG